VEEERSFGIYQQTGATMNNNKTFAPAIKRLNEAGIGFNWYLEPLGDWLDAVVSVCKWDGDRASTLLDEVICYIGEVRRANLKASRKQVVSA
jgi:hypothetical protein